MDVLWHLVKDDQFRDNPPNPQWSEGMEPYQALLPVLTTDRPEVQEIVLKMRRLLDQYSARVMIGEIYLPLERLVKYYGENLAGAHLPFNFQLVGARWDARHIAASSPNTSACFPPVRGRTGCWVTTTSIASPRAWARRRRASRRCCSSRCAARRRSTTATRSACATMDPDRTRARTRSSAMCRAAAWAAIPSARRCSGVGERRQASPRQSRGFRSLPDYREVNVENSGGDARSMLALYRRLHRLAPLRAALETGSFTLVDAPTEVLAYVRGSPNERVAISSR
jgi:alpha-glucosidase